MKTTHTYRFAAPPEKVAEVLSSIEFHLEMDRGRDDIASSAIDPPKKIGDIVEFTMRSQEYKRTKTGKLDRSGTEEGRTVFRFNERARTLEWVYTPESWAKQVDVKGIYRIQPEGAGTALVHEYTVDIRIPLIGGQIAKIVDKAFRESFPRFEATFRRYLTR